MKFVVLQLKKGAFSGTGFLLFLAFWTSGPVLKKKLGSDCEQFLRVVFSCFLGFFDFILKTL